jgi:pimeloyl-ACP methyl ester carboxylesterase
MRKVISTLAQNVSRAACALLLSAPLAALAQAPDALFKDPPRDPNRPARLFVVHIPTHGTHINGVIYGPSGTGPHPVVILFHGLPGNEQNLDLAQALRRAGWSVLTLHYRGSWGSPGTYSYQHLIEDGQAAVEFVRDARNDAKYALDAQRIVLAGHSTGGFVATLTAAAQPQIRALVLISASDDAGEAIAASSDPHKWREWINDSFDEEESLIGCTPEALAREVRAHAQSWSFARVAPRLTRVPMLMITAEDGFRAENDAFARSIVASGGSAPRRVHMQTDHPYSDHRIALQEAVVNWLEAYRTAG